MKPVRLLVRISAILCGIALTWACAAIGLVRVQPTGCRRPGIKTAKVRVRVVEQALVQFEIEKNRWPTTADLVDEKYLSPRDLVDPWGTVVVYRFSGDDPTVISAGPDHEFGTEDDVKNTD